MRRNHYHLIHLISIPGDPGLDLVILKESLGTVKNEAAGGPINWFGSVSTESGEGLGSRDSDSGVTTPLMFPLAAVRWLGETGADLELFAWLREKHEIGRCRLLLNACSTSFGSDAGSILQNEPFPGSSWDRATFWKYRFNDRLWRMEFYKEAWNHIR